MNVLLTFSLQFCSLNIPIAGQTLNYTGNLVDAFWGIPFAKPPTGDLRFAPPQPSEPWSGVRNANLKILKCPQHEFQTPVGAEDCLYLNIYRPRNSTVTKAPVMVATLLLSFESYL